MLPGSIAYLPADEVPGWLTTDSSNTIELWRAGDNPPRYPAYEGNQFAEINYLEDSQLHQDLDTSTLVGQTIEWGFAHRGRTGVDTMGLYIGPPGAEVEIQQFSTGAGDWVYYSGTYTVPAGQTLTRFAYRAIETATGNPSVGNLIDAVSFGTPPCETDLAVAKTAAPTYTPGGSIEFTIEITNTGAVPGQFDVVGATLIDTVPAEITGVTWECVATPGSACGEASGTGNDINTTFDILEGGTVTYTVTGTAPDTVPQPVLTNTATVTLPAGVADLNPVNNSSTVHVAPAPVSSDLSVTKVAEPDPVQRNGELVYTIQVSNAGPDAADDATVVATLPADVTFVSVDGGADWDCTYDAGTHTVSCAATSPIAAGVAPAAIIITVTAPPIATSVENQVEVSSSTDTNTANNTAETSTTVVDTPYTPFICDGSAYLIQDEQAQLYRVNTSVSPYAFEAIGDASPYQINAIGYHPVQNVLYGWAYHNASNVIGLVRIDATGQVTELGLVNNLPVQSYLLGAITDDGATYYVAAGSTLYAIDIDSMSATTIPLSAATQTFDFAVGPDGFLYGGVGAGLGVVVRIDPVSGTVGTIAVDGLMTTGSYGGAWFTADGHLAIYHNSGVLYQIDLYAPGGPTIIGSETGPSSSLNDAAACAAREPSADLRITKTSDPSVVGVGETITYTLQVFNAGPDSAADVVVTDTLPAGLASVDGVTGDGWSCTATMSEVECTYLGALGLGYAPPITIAVTAGDTGGELVNSATVESSTEDPNEEDNHDNTTTFVSSPGIVVNKVAELITELQLGDTIEYYYHVTNTGNVTLSNITLNDDLIGQIACPSSSLLPGETMTCVGEYVVSQPDFDAGEIINIATVTGEDPNGGEVEHTDTERVPNAQQPGITIDKFAEPVTERAVGDRITYYYVVTNTGNVTLTNIDVADDLIPDVTCPVTTLAPNESTICTGEYEIDQDDFDAGSVTNIATVTGEDPNGDEIEDEDQETVPNEDQEPRILVDKVADDETDIQVGDVITFRFVVTNTGNVTLTTIAIDDPLIPTVSCPATTLAPSELTTCTGEYEITQADLDTGEIVNVATVTGDDPNGDPVEDDDTERVTLDQRPGLSFTKRATQVDAINQGDIIEYRFVVTNTGNVTLTNIVVADPLIPDISCPATALVPGAAMTCTGEYEVSQADVDTGQVVNRAAVTADDPNGDPLEEEDEEIVPSPQQPSIQLTKSAEHSGRLGIGDVIEFRFVITNTGNVTLTNIAIDDPLIPTVSCPATTLAPSESMTCTGSYMVTRADVIAGEVVNHALVRGEDPNGDPIEDDDVETVSVDRNTNPPTGPRPPTQDPTPTPTDPADPPADPTPTPTDPVDPPADDDDDDKPPYPQLPPATDFTDPYAAGSFDSDIRSKIVMIVLGIGLLIAGVTLAIRQRRGTMS